MYLTRSRFIYSINLLTRETLPGKEIPGIPLSLQPASRGGQTGCFTTHQQIRKAAVQPEQQSEHREAKINRSVAGIPLAMARQRGEECMVGHKTPARNNRCGVS